MKKVHWIAVVATTLAGVWYFFPPELVFVDRTIAEAAPEAGIAVLRGEFRGVAYQTTGVATVLWPPGGERLLRLSRF